MIAQTTDHIATEGPKYGVYLKESKLKAYMPMMYSGLPDSALEQDALDYAKGQLMIADRGYEVSSDGLERVLGAPVTMVYHTKVLLDKSIIDKSIIQYCSDKSITRQKYYSELKPTNT